MPRSATARRRRTLLGSFALSGALAVGFGAGALAADSGALDVGAASSAFSTSDGRVDALTEGSDGLRPEADRVPEGLSERNANGVAKTSKGHAPTANGVAAKSKQKPANGVAYAVAPGTANGV